MTTNERCLLIDTVVASDKNVSFKGYGNINKYTDVESEK